MRGVDRSSWPSAVLWVAVTEACGTRGKRAGSSLVVGEVYVCLSRMVFKVCKYQKAKRSDVMKMDVRIGIECSETGININMLLCNVCTM